MTTTSSVGIAQDAVTTSLNSTAKTTLDKQDFLRLLIAQMKNQDPLSPMESYEFAAQLAQFTSVEQLTNISSTLDDNLTMDLLMTQAINNTLAINLIGQRVVGQGNTVNLQSGSATLHFALGGFAHTVKVTITNSSGDTVRTLYLTDQQAGRRTITWDGKSGNGLQLSDGTYTFTVEAYDADGNTVGTIPLIIGQVMGVKYQDGAGILNINGQEIPFSQVIEVGNTTQDEGNL